MVQILHFSEKCLKIWKHQIIFYSTNLHKISRGITMLNISIFKRVTREIDSMWFQSKWYYKESSKKRPFKTLHFRSIGMDSDVSLNTRPLPTDGHTDEFEFFNCALSRNYVRTKYYSGHFLFYSLCFRKYVPNYSLFHSRKAQI